MKLTIRYFKLFLSFLPFLGFAQQKQGEAPVLTEVKGYFEGYEVDVYRKLQKDTIFFVDSKMRIRPGYFECKIDSEEYVLFRYPDFKNVQVTSIDTITKLGLSETVYVGLWKYNGKTIAIKRKDFEKLEKTEIFGSGINKKVKFVPGEDGKIKKVVTRNWVGFKMVSGQLTLPFKLRPAIKDQKFQMTTDVTIGAYAGFRQRLSPKQDIFLTIPATAGLSYININSNNTSVTLPSNEKGDRIVPGVTWCTGLLLQVNKFNAGFVFGKDYASQVAEDWIYHNQLWYSFAIGFSFSTAD